MFLITLMGELVYLLHNSVKQPPIRFELFYNMLAIALQLSTSAKNTRVVGGLLTN
jgi:hypothetical protein